MSYPALGTASDAARRLIAIEQTHLPGAAHIAAIAGEARVMTLRGPRPAHTITTGDTLLTVGNGPQPVLWRRITFANETLLDARPDLRPVVLKPGRLAPGAPRTALRLSPDTGILAPSDTLVYAADFADQSDRCAITYVHFLLPRHCLIAADGVVVETLHPARLGPPDRDLQAWSDIYGLRPDLDDDPWAYGPEVRARLRRAL